MTTEEARANLIFALNKVGDYKKCPDLWDAFYAYDNLVKPSPTGTVRILCNNGLIKK